MSQKEKNERIPFTLTYSPYNLAAKNIILSYSKITMKHEESFHSPTLISFKHDKNVGSKF